MVKPNRKKSVEIKPPDNVRPYLSHGLDLDWEASDNPMCECPFCGKNKFAVFVETGQAKCWTCGISSSKKSSGLNASSFIRELHKLHLKSTTDQQLQKLADDRSLYSIDILKKLQVAWNGIDWLIPAYNQDGLMNQLYRYTRGANGMLCLPTPTLGSGMFGMNLINKSVKSFLILEGLWDVAAGLEAIEGYNIIGVPGVNNFKETWLELFSGSKTVIGFDNDHPKIRDGVEVQLGGKQGMIRIGSMLKSYENPPNIIQFLKWGPDGYSTELKDGADVRDVISGKVSFSA